MNVLRHEPREHARQVLQQSFVDVLEEARAPAKLVDLVSEVGTTSADTPDPTPVDLAPALPDGSEGQHRSIYEERRGNVRSLEGEHVIVVLVRREGVERHGPRALAIEIELLLVLPREMMELAATELEREYRAKLIALVERSGSKREPWSEYVW